MRNEIALEPKMVPAHLRGSYNGKSFSAIVTESVTVPSHAGLWDSGSRDTFDAVHLADGRKVAVSDNVSAPWDDRKSRVIPLIPGIAVIEHSIFCGKDMGLRFYVHPNDAAAMLPSPAAPLTDIESMVLRATATLKSSYNGKDRYQMTTDDLRYSGKPCPSRDQWNAAKDSLIAAGLLNAAGAITVKGRNSVPR